MLEKSASDIHVAMLVHAYYPSDARVRREAEALIDAGLKVHVICMRPPKEDGHPTPPRKEVVNKVEVYRVPLSKRRGSNFRYFYEYSALALLGAWRLFCLHLTKKLRVVHIHNMPDFLVFAGLIPKLIGAKLVLDIHDPMPELYSSMNSSGMNRLFLSALKYQEKMSCSLADRVISVNDTMRENLAAKGIPLEKIFILHNFPDSKYFPIAHNGTRWPRHNGQLVLLYIGNVTDHYDLSVAIKAVALAAGSVPNIKLKITRLGNPTNLQEVTELINKLGIGKHVELMRGVPLEKVRFEMEKADIGISSHKAGLFGDLYFSTKIVEYMTQGLPVLTSHTYTIAKYLPENSAFYFEPGNYLDMARQIINIWHNQDEVRKKLQNAKNSLSRFSWETEKKRFINYYNNLLAK